MSSTAINELHTALGLGLGIVSRIWDYKVKDWVTSVFAADINNDGKAEFIACSRDGRVHVLSSTGDCLWERIVGTKDWIGAAIASGVSKTGEDTAVRIIIGTRDGKVYVLDKDGKTISKSGKAFAFDSDGRAIEPKEEQEAYWYNTGYVIRRLYVDPDQPTTIIFGSEDRYVYVLDYESGELLWKYQTNGWVRTVFSCDIDGDGEAEVLVGSVDKHLYVFDQQGSLRVRHNMGHAVQTIFAADVDNDGHIEVIVGTDGKDLVALSYHADELNPHGHFQEKWHHHFNNRVLSLCVTDIDNDGKSELIVGSEDKHIYILDAHGKTIWQHNHKYRIFSLFPYDIDNDGLPELLIGSEDNRARVMRIRLQHQGLLRKIRKYYHKLAASEPTALTGFTIDESSLLQDIIRKDVKEEVTLQHAEDVMSAGKYAQALSVLLKLEQDKVERLLHTASIGHIRTVSLRHTASDPKREIIVSNTEGDIQAFNASGRRLWSAHLDDHIIDVQTGFIDHHRQEEIVACSSDHCVYILSGARKPKQRDMCIDTWMSSICVTTPDVQGQSRAEIIIGSEDKKLYIYGSNLEQPIDTIATHEGIRLVRAHVSNQTNEPEIVAASLGKRVYAYTRSGKELWWYDTRDHIRAVCIKDINGDGKVEVLIGSEDRNIHVLDSNGRLLWRFFLPHSALAIDAEDVDQDGNMEIFVGCADGYLHVLSKDGDLLWKYQASERIHAVRVEDIDNDGNVEIALGSEDELELLRVVNQTHVHTLMNECWAAVSQQQLAQAIHEHLENPDPFLKAFALSKLAEQHPSSKDFLVFEQYMKESSIQVRKTLIGIVMTHYTVNPAKARQMLLHLSMDRDLDVKNTFIEQILILMKYDWELGFHYLRRFLEHPDRCVRRMVVRTLYQLIDTPVDGKKDRHGEIFDLLLFAAKDKESEWISQEAARSLAHYLNSYHGSLIIYVHQFIAKEIQTSTLRRIAYATTADVVKHYMNAVILMLSDLNAENALERTQQIVKALKDTSTLPYGKDLYLLYAELQHLLTINTIDDIAGYQCVLKVHQFPTLNEFAGSMLNVFEDLSSISRTLKIYLMRTSIHDRLSSLLETIAAIEKMNTYLEQSSSLEEPITKLPDHYLFALILKRWRGIVMEQLSKLRGKPELKAELQSKYARYEQQVGIWFTVSNSGRISATNVMITLLYSENFTVVGTQSFKTEAILPQEETTREFIIRPRPGSTALELQLEVVYDDVEGVTKHEVFGDRLELEESHHEFHSIPTPYSTGTPTHDSRMFYGREVDMAFLKDNLTRDAKTVIVLYGQRRSGKTTMLLQLINTCAFDEHIPVFIDMQRLSYHISISNFLYKVARAIAQAMQKKEILICLPEMADFRAEPTSAFDAFLDHVEEHLTQRKLILMIDEFEVLEEQVVKGKLEPEIFEYLRDILQHRQNINFLFSGTHKITEYTKWYRSVFFNIARHYRLSRLNPQGAEDLIQKPITGFLEYEPLTVKKIRQLTADQPYLIHLMCRAIIDYCNEKCKTYVTINDINTILRDVMQTGQFHFDWLWDQISPEDRIALSAIAEGGQDEGRWLSRVELEEIYRHNGIRFTREYLWISLQTLLDADLIENSPSNSTDSTYDSNRFRIPVGLTREWLHKEKPLELVRKELSN